MANKLEFRKGYLKLQRLGPIKFGKQARWSIRAPESKGMWAFPAPYFDEFYAYHRWVDLSPKAVRERYPTELKWWRRYREENEEPYTGSYELESEYDHEDKDYPLESYDEILWDEDGRPDNAYIIPEYSELKTNWINNVGKKILPVKEFWYSGELYTHFKPNGEVGAYSMRASEPVEWSRMDTYTLYKILKKPGSVAYQFGFEVDGRPRILDYAKDHLEIFIPEGLGKIVSKPF